MERDPIGVKGMDHGRRELLGLAGAAAVAAAASAFGAPVVGRRVQEEREATMDRAETRMPVLFVGHGSPMNAIEDNRWSRAFRAIGQELPRPKAVLSISAHWWTQGTFLTGGARPRTIHDFGGFPRPLYEVQYPAPGSPDLAARVAALLGAEPEDRAVTPVVRDDWGLDHGTWSVLRHMLPGADIPVVQLSLNARSSAKQHFELARALHPLRGEGVLVLGSGNVTHNLRDAMGRASRGELATPAWAEQFDREVALALRERDTAHLVGAWPDGQHARQAHPHPDHWFPLLYACAATEPEDAVGFPVEGFDLGSLSMRAVRWG